jgi:hypothetical protein
MARAATTKQIMARTNRTDYSFRVALHRKHSALVKLCRMSGLAPSAKTFGRSQQGRGEGFAIVGTTTNGNNKDIQE